MYPPPYPIANQPRYPLTIPTNVGYSTNVGYNTHSPFLLGHNNLPDQGEGGVFSDYGQAVTHPASAPFDYPRSVNSGGLLPSAYNNLIPTVTYHHHPQSTYPVSNPSSFQPQYPTYVRAPAQGYAPAPVPAQVYAPVPAPVNFEANAPTQGFAQGFAQVPAPVQVYAPDRAHSDSSKIMHEIAALRSQQSTQNGYSANYSAPLELNSNNIVQNPTHTQQTPQGDWWTALTELSSQFLQFKNDITTQVISFTSKFDEKIKDLKRENNDLKLEMADLRQEIQNLKQKNTTLKQDVDNLKQENADLKNQLKALQDSVDKIRHSFKGWLEDKSTPQYQAESLHEKTMSETSELPLLIPILQPQQQQEQPQPQPQPQLPLPQPQQQGTTSASQQIGSFDNCGGRPSVIREPEEVPPPQIPVSWETPNPAQGKPVIPYVDYASSNAEQRANTRMTYEISEAEPRIKKSEKYKDISTNFEEKFKDISGDWSLSKSLFPDTHKESVLHKALLVQAKLLNLALTNKETAQSIVSKIGEEGVSFNENEQKILTAISEIFASKNLNSDSKLKDQLKDQLMEGLHFFKDDQFKIATTIPSESQIMILVNNKQSIEEILRICGQIPRDPSKKIDANNLHSLIRATFIWKAHEEFEKQNSSILGGGSDATVAANAPAHSPDSGAGVCEGGLGAPAGAPAPVAVVAGGATASAPSATPANTSDGFANAVDKTKAEGRNLIGSA